MKRFFIILGIISFTLIASMFFVSAQLNFNTLNLKQIELGQPLISAIAVPLCLKDGSSCGYAIVPIVLIGEKLPTQNNFPMNRVVGEPQFIYYGVNK